MTALFKSRASTASLVRRTLVVGAVVASVGLVLSSSLFPHASQAQQNAAGSVPQQVVVRGLPDFTELVDRVGPSVVSIRTTQRVSAGGAGGTGNEEMDAQMREFFRRFFGMPMPGPAPTPGPRRNGPPGTEPGEERPRGLGSGFILTPDGFVMTNAHVIEGADEVYVSLTDKREYKARVVGVDKRTDVAVVKIEAARLPAVTIGDVSRLKVGEWVMAIGTPFGLDNTVTAGIVSAKARDTGEEIRFIQTDVAVNPGNSGGPLINMRGEVVGINSQILSRSGGFMGISLSIPIDDAMRVADQLRADGRVTRGRIGVSIGPVSKEVAESLGLGRPTGALIQGVEAGTPAEKAGIEAGDIVTRFNGQVIDGPSDLSRMVAATRPGSRVTAQVLRRGNYRDVTLTVAELEAPRPRTAAPAEPRPGTALTAFGLTVNELTAEQRRELRQAGGVVIEAVDGPAARAGLRQGDVILAVGNVQVTGVKQIEAALAKIDRNRPVSLLVRRGEWAQYVVIRPAR